MVVHNGGALPCLANKSLGLVQDSGHNGAHDQPNEDWLEMGLFMPPGFVSFTGARPDIGQLGRDLPLNIRRDQKASEK